ncbi:uncharacterized protein LOC131334514 [Rhododendron vialii]|uniref:uncharacterized protein LOC131334514 n=1 Tax=Rhododendron vialii TaxID=182163 RepID=UPI00265DD2DC|nr:uncharacterized protein LOC131334514 [Rhododendron vialii]
MASRGPQLLKDYLAADSNSCSSSGFRSFPRRLQHHSTQTVRTLLQIDLNTNTPNSPVKLTRSRSKAVKFFSNAVKLFPFNTVKSRREEFRGNYSVVVRGASGPFKVKDILRWKSFRDLVEEDSPPLDFYDGTTTSTGSASSSNTSATSWCDSDFTAEELPCWGGNSCEYLEGKRFSPEVSVGGDSDSTVDPKGDASCEEIKEQNSPVSVLNFPIQEDEQSFSPFHQCLENLERRKHMLLQDLEHFEHLSTKLGPTNVEDKCLDEEYSDCKEYHGDHDDKCVQKGGGNEEKARQMLNHIRTTSSLETREASVDQLLLDFFSNELGTSRNQNDARFDCGILRVAEDWVSGKYESFEWEMEGKREAFVRDMERGERWKKFEEEIEELAMEMEAWVLDYLVDELVVDLSFSLKTQKD